jgi:hypothetical protein
LRKSQEVPKLFEKMKIFGQKINIFFKNANCIGGGDTLTPSTPLNSCMSGNHLIRTLSDRDPQIPITDL